MAEPFRSWQVRRWRAVRHRGGHVGRADVILDQEGGVPSALAIVDYKTAITGDFVEHGLQMQVYADAGRREGLDVRGAYVHDLKAAAREPVPVDPASVDRAETAVTAAAARIRARDYAPNPGQRCRRCEVRTICHSAIR
jgi:DNA helicase-2/ATP-dependent DNA helicase PcrA